MTILRQNYNYYGQYEYSAYYSYTRAYGTALEKTSSVVYSISQAISGIWDFVRAKCSRTNIVRDSYGIYSEIQINSPYVYSQVVDLLADYAGYKIRVKATDSMERDVSLEEKEAV